MDDSAEDRRSSRFGRRWSYAKRALLLQRLGRLKSEPFGNFSMLVCRLVLPVVISIACLTSPSFVAAQRKEEGRLASRHFTTDQSGGHGLARSLEQHPDGTIVAACESNVVIFDGVSWLSIRHPRELGFLSLDIAVNGTVYLGCQGDFGYLKANSSGSYEFVSLSKQLGQSEVGVGNIRQVMVSPTGVFFLSRQALHRWQPTDDIGESGAMTSWIAPSGFEFAAICQLDRRVMVGQDQLGLAELVGDAFEPLPGTHTIRSILSISPLETSRLLVSNRDGLFVYDYQEKTLREFESPANRYAQKHVGMSILPIPDHRLVMSTNTGGVCVFDHTGRIQRVVSRDGGLRSNSIFGVTRDREGGLWIASGFGIEYVALESGAEYFDDIVDPQSMARFGDSLYIGTNYGVMTLRSSDRIGQTSTSRLVPGLTGSCYDLLVADDRLFALSDGVVEISEDGTQKHHQVPGFVGDLEICPRGDLIVAGTFYGGAHLLQRHDGTWSYEGPIGGTSRNVRRVVCDASGYVWLSVKTLDDKFRLERVELKSLDNLTGSVGGGSPLIKAYDEEWGLLRSVTPFFPFMWKGSLYVSSSTQMYRYDPDKDYFFPTSLLHNGPPVEGVTAVSTDHQGSLWLATSKRFPLLRIADDTWEAITIPLQDSTAKRFRNLLCESDGLFWAISSDGFVVRYDEPKTPASRGTKPILRVFNESGVLFGGTVPTHWLSPTIPFSKKDRLRFEYASPDYTAPFSTRYQVRMVGLSDEWSDWTEETRQVFPSLRAGDYTFQVRGRNEYGLVSNVTSIDLQVSPPWPQTWWAYIIYGSTGLLLMLGLIRARVRATRARVAELESEIAKRQQAQQLLNEANNELRATQEQVVQQARLSALGEMASGVAHDLNNTLSPVLAFTELLLEDDVSQEDAEAFLKTIQTCTEDAVEVIKRLRSFHIREHSYTQVTRLDHLVSQIPDLTRPKWSDQARQTGREVRIETELHEVAAVCNPSEIREVLINLVFNAVDAIPGDGVVRLQLTQEDQLAIIQVTDTGVGMNAENCARCFEPFYSTKSSQGSGLGLSTCYGIVQRHGGRIEVQSSDGHGTTFRIQLPVGTLSKPEPTRRPIGKLAPWRVLYVEDDDRVRPVVQALLVRLGQRVDVFGTGEAALTAFVDGEYDLLITDQGMPGMDGSQLSQAVRDLNPDIPVIIVSGWDTPDIRAACDVLLQKPVAQEDLWNAIHEVQRRAILVIDDDPFVLSSTSALLQSDGHQVLTAASAAEGIELLVEHRKLVGTVLLDLTMQGSDPARVLQDIRRISNRIRVIIVTGHDVEPVAKQLTGCAAYLQKPVRPDVLFKALQTSDT